MEEDIEMNDERLLEMINRELVDLYTLSMAEGLKESHIRSLNNLVKLRQLILKEPTEITQVTEMEKQLEEEIANLSPEELTQMIRQELYGREEETSRGSTEEGNSEQDTETDTSNRQTH